MIPVSICPPTAVPQINPGSVQEIRHRNALRLCLSAHINLRPLSASEGTPHSFYRTIRYSPVNEPPYLLTTRIEENRTYNSRHTCCE